MSERGKIRHRIAQLTDEWHRLENRKKEISWEIDGLKKQLASDKPHVHTADCYEDDGHGTSFNRVCNF